MIGLQPLFLLFRPLGEYVDLLKHHDFFKSTAYGTEPSMSFRLSFSDSHPSAPTCKGHIKEHRVDTRGLPFIPNLKYPLFLYSPHPHVFSRTPLIKDASKSIESTREDSLSRLSSSTFPPLSRTLALTTAWCWTRRTSGRCTRTCCSGSSRSSSRGGQGWGKTGGHYSQFGGSPIK